MDGKFTYLSLTVGLVCTFLSLGQGCSTLPPLKVDSTKFIMVHKDGYPLISEDNLPTRDLRAVGTTVDAVLQKVIGGLDAYVKDVCASHGENQKARILLFVHGGLNNYEEGLSRIDELIGADGLILGSYYPIFVLWNGGLGSSIYDDLIEVRRGERWPLWSGLLTSPFVAIARLGNTFGVGASFVPMLRDTFLTTKAWRGKGTIMKPLWAVTHVAFLPVRDFVIYPGLKAFGAGAWDIMNRRARLAVAPKLEENLYATEGVVRAFLTTLQRWLSAEHTCGTKDNHEKPVTIEVTVVGHSMGTLVLDEILRAFPRVPFKRIVYMASASSIRDVETAVLPYLDADSNQDAKFWAFTLSEVNETRSDWLWLQYSGLGEGSLLVWIDDLFQNVTTQNQLRFGRWENLKQYEFCKQYVERYKGQVMIAQFTGEGENEPKAHGDFDDKKIFFQVLKVVDGQEPLPEDRCPK